MNKTIQIFSVIFIPITFLLYLIYFCIIFPSKEQVPIISNHSQLEKYGICFESLNERNRSEYYNYINEDPLQEEWQTTPWGQIRSLTIAQQFTIEKYLNYFENSFHLTPTHHIMPKTIKSINFSNHNITNKEWNEISNLLPLIKQEYRLCQLSHLKIPSKVLKTFFQLNCQAFVLENIIVPNDCLNTPINSNIKMVVLDQNQLQGNDFKNLLLQLNQSKLLLLKVVNNPLDNLILDSKKSFSFSSLYEINLNNTTINDKNLLPILKDAPKLKILKLNQTQVSGKIFQHFSSSLVDVSLDLCPISLDEITFKNHPGIYHLSLKGTSITISCLLNLLSDLPNLTFLDIRQTKIEEKHINLIKEKYPQLKVFYLSPK